jgi:hypothetical protein
LLGEGGIERHWTKSEKQKQKKNGWLFLNYGVTHIFFLKKTKQKNMLLEVI